MDFGGIISTLGGGGGRRTRRTRMTYNNDAVNRRYGRMNDGSRHRAAMADSAATTAAHNAAIDRHNAKPSGRWFHGKPAPTKKANPLAYTPKAAKASNGRVNHYPPNAGGKTTTTPQPDATTAATMPKASNGRVNHYPPNKPAATPHKVGANAGANLLESYRSAGRAQRDTMAGIIKVMPRITNAKPIEKKSAGFTDPYTQEHISGKDAKTAAIILGGGGSALMLAPLAIKGAAAYAARSALPKVYGSATPKMPKMDAAFASGRSRKQGLLFLSPKTPKMDAAFTSGRSWILRFPSPKKPLQKTKPSDGNGAVINPIPFQANLPRSAWRGRMGRL